LKLDTFILAWSDYGSLKADSPGVGPLEYSENFLLPFILPVDTLGRTEVHGLFDFIFRTVKTRDLGNFHAFLVAETTGAGFCAASTGNTLVFIDKEFFGHFCLLLVL
jgi:hypothetical protein